MASTPTKRYFEKPSGERAMTTSAAEATSLLARGYTEIKRGGAKNPPVKTDTTDAK